MSMLHGSQTKINTHGLVEYISIYSCRYVWYVRVSVFQNFAWRSEVSPPAKDYVTAAYVSAGWECTGLQIQNSHSL